MHSYESLLHCYQGLSSLGYKCFRANIQVHVQGNKGTVQFSNQCALDFSIFCTKTRSVIPKFVNGKTLKKRVNLPDFKFCLPKLIKYFPIWCNVKFSLLFRIVYCSENRLTINITPYGEFFFYYLTYRDEIKDLQGYIF